MKESNLLLKTEKIDEINSRKNVLSFAQESCLR